MLTPHYAAQQLAIWKYGSLEELETLKAKNGAKEANKLLKKKQCKKVP